MLRKSTSSVNVAEQPVGALKRAHSAPSLGLQPTAAQQAAAEREEAEGHRLRQSLAAAEKANDPALVARIKAEQDKFVLAALKRRLPADVFENYDMQRSDEGWSGLHCVQVKMDNNTYHAKFLTAPQQLAVSKEILAARYFAERRVAPEVVYSDAASNLLLTEKKETLATGEVWWEMAREPHVLPALIACIADFHDLHRQKESVTYDPALLQAELDNKLERLANCGDKVDAAEVKELSRLGAQCIATLQHLSYRPVLCHNDMQQLNILHDGKRAWLIDWHSVKKGDPAMEWVNFFSHLESYTVDMDAMLAKLPERVHQTDAGLILRARALQKWNCVQRLCAGLIGVPWGTDFAGLRQTLGLDKQDK